jgi:general stress protein YciG
VTWPTWQRFETGGYPIAPYLAARCMRLLNGEIEIPRSTLRKRTPAECAAMAKNPHRFTRTEAQAAGKRGGEPFKGRSEYMANLGRKGGTADDGGSKEDERTENDNPRASDSRGH